MCESCAQRQKPVGQISDLGWVVVQRVPVVHTKMLDEGELDEGKAQRRSSQTLWP
jgi:hypothetical protein